MRNTFLLILIAINLSVTCSDMFHKHKHHITESQEMKLAHKANEVFGLPRKLATADWHPMKVYYDLSSLDGLKTSDAEMHAFIKDKLVPATMQHLTDSLTVREERNNKIRTSWCAWHTVPSSLVNTDLAYDLVILITLDSSVPRGVVAWAAPCAYHPLTNRPIAGRVALNPNAIKTAHKHFSNQFGVLMHEIYHILGFNEHLYQFFIDPLTNSVKKIEDVYTRNGSGSHKWQIITPKVTQLAREHFGCEEMTGLPIESSGGEGSAGSHWEKLLMLNEFMVAQTVANPIISKFTLALLEDSGWYQPDYNYAEPVFYLKDEGCGVQLSKCEFYGKTCGSSVDWGCFYDYTFKSYCLNDYFMNDCKLYSAVDTDIHDCRFDNKDSHSDSVKEYFGAGSRCFKTSLRSRFFMRIGHSCYKSSCNDLGQVVVKVGDEEFTCLTTGQVLRPTSVSGTITCPDIDNFCAHEARRCPNECNHRGRCHEGNYCYCYPGFSGNACQFSDDDKVDEDDTGEEAPEEEDQPQDNEDQEGEPKNDGDSTTEQEDTNSDETNPESQPEEDTTTGGDSTTETDGGSTSNPIKCEPVCKNGFCKKGRKSRKNFCRCFKYFTGEDCSTKNIPEKLNPNNCNPVCQNGICKTRRNGKTVCKCFKGFTGGDCNTKVDLSIPPTCSPACINGDCKRRWIGNSFCKCDKGFKGKDCDIQTDPNSQKRSAKKGGDSLDKLHSHSILLSIEFFLGVFLAARLM